MYRNVIEKAVKQVSKNLFDLGLDLAPQKTVLMHFNDKNIKPGESKIKIDEHTIKSSATRKFLGIIFHYKLSFILQINQVQNKYTRALKIIRYLRGTW